MIYLLNRKDKTLISKHVKSIPREAILFVMNNTHTQLFQTLTEYNLKRIPKHTRTSVCGHFIDLLNQELPLRCSSTGKGVGWRERSQHDQTVQFGFTDSLD